jgi:hypothetical protein
VDALLTGIYNRYLTTNDFRTACTGGLHLEEAPQNTALPYATYALITGRPEWIFRGNDEVVTIQFDLYASTNAVRQSLYTKLTALYDDCRPTVTGYLSIIMERQFQQMLRSGDQDKEFRYIVDYEVRIKKT